jgi:peptidoglycan-N-acetylglucosamine deacetylase
VQVVIAPCGARSTAVAREGWGTVRLRSRVGYVIVSTIAVLAAVAPSAPARVAHTVEPGETLWSIALANHLTTPLLAAANSLSAGAHILAGSTISVPSLSEAAIARAWQVQPGAPRPRRARGYVVRPGDSLSAIAASSGVSVGELASLNGLDPTDTLLFGTRLKLPTEAPVASTAAAVRPRAGCTRHGAPFRTNGSRRHRTVALTFDDGPSPYTHRVLRILRRFRVPATFFLIGQQVGPFRREARAELRAGEEIGNHSLRHSFLPSRGDLARTNQVIRRATGFRPCLFRPPGGAVNSRVVGSALSLGMDTITWDVDPRDWSRPGTGAIVSRVLGAVRPGSIVLMHDGGGPRGETVAALPTILRVLRHRGYRFETVSALLGDKLVWLPGRVRL